MLKNASNQKFLQISHNLPPKKSAIPESTVLNPLRHINYPRTFA